MIDEPPHNGILDHLNDIKEYIVSVAVVFGVLLTHYLSIRKRLIVLEETSVSHNDLASCRDDVRNDDAKNTAKVMNEIKEIASKTEMQTEKLAEKNANEHQVITDKQDAQNALHNKQHNELMNTLIELIKK